ncbi:MAG TPA: hypothetical protein VFF06_24300 [Polyangia bacterium]|nr:hypothetical protein [Polyangia bacterium]
MPPQQLAAVAGAVAFVVLCIYLVVRYKAKIRAAFEGFATKHGLKFTGGSFPSAAGKIDGRHTVVQSRPEPRQKIAYFQIQIGVCGILPQGMLAFARGVFDSKGIRTGDAELDERVHIDAPDAQAVIAWLTPERRAALLDLAAARHAFAVPAKPNDVGPVVVMDQPGFKPRLDWIEEKYQQVLALARRLDA